MKRRADRIRWGNKIALASGGTVKVTDVRHIETAERGTIIEITLDNGAVLRRTPGAKLDLVK